MNTKNTKRLIATSLLLIAVAYDAHATLTSITGAGGAGLVYSSVSNITWTQDANLLRTLISNQGYDNVVNAIIAASPTIMSTPNTYDGNTGIYNVSASDFSGDGTTSWFGAQAFTHYLNSINYGGSNQWRLPNASGWGYGGNSGNEMGQLFYNELGGAQDNNIPDTNYFTNEQVPMYWLGTELIGMPDFAWKYFTSMGFVDFNLKWSSLYAWPVTPGQVSAVPLPGSVWMMSSVLIGLLGWKRRMG